MNYKNINALVIKYKESKKRVERNNLILEIIKEYEPIIKTVENKSYNREETRSIFIFQLLKCIDMFKPSREISFNTFAYIYLVSVYRQTISQTGYFKYKINTSSEYSTDDVEFESNFIIDLQKILTADEIMAYKLNLYKNIANNKLLESAKYKINKYLFDN